MSTLYRVSADGWEKSTNGGKTWRKSGPPPVEHDDFAECPDPESDGYFSWLNDPLARDLMWELENPVELDTDDDGSD